MNKQLYFCDSCCSKDSEGVLQTEEYRLNASNFKRTRIETVAEGNGNMPSMPTSKEYLICTICQAKDVNFVKSLKALTDVLDANKATMAGGQ